MFRSTLCVLFLLTLITPFASAAEPHPGYRVLGGDKGKIAILDRQGQVEWQTECQGSTHDLSLLDNGNVLFLKDATTVVEMDRNHQVVWQYAAQPKTGYTGAVEVHAAQRLAGGLTLVAESGNQQLVEVDPQGRIVHTIPLTIQRPHPHRDTRLVRKLDSGTYLVCHEGDGIVREYDRAGKVVWSYQLDLNGRPASAGHGHEAHGNEVYGAIRLPNGNTLIGGGNNNRVIEVNPAGQVVWSLDQNEVPGQKLAWVTTVALLPNGNLLIGNCHAGPDYPQMFEITRDKQVVWTFRNFQTFGNGLAMLQVLDVPGVIR